MNIRRSQSVNSEHEITKRFGTCIGSKNCDEEGDRKIGKCIDLTYLERGSFDIKQEIQKAKLFECFNNSAPYYSNVRLDQQSTHKEDMRFLCHTGLL